MLGKSKVFEVPQETAKALFNSERAFVGFCGGANNISDALTWLHDISRKPPKLNEVEMLFVTSKKQIFHANTFKSFLEISDKYFSIGSGSKFALGAMASGATPLEAVKAAAKLDPYTGMGYVALSM